MYKYLILMGGLFYFFYRGLGYVKIKESDFLGEHERLINVLASGSKSKIKKELKLQQKELEEYLT